ncbi:5029_t:CDS:2 [Funneliformis mosseae]|uniref:5029_t:CDS:1 n=1 Tax=Funneliformis mosseae TaxID=27381 RepID=A0A9N9F247_FUNMO|nr:5029_t:CDS:2 [Funneliformis mosseae]
MLKQFGRLIINQNKSTCYKPLFYQNTRGFHSTYIAYYADVKTFDKILIANRGEIACRVIRTAKKMGIKTVAIYSDADARGLHIPLSYIINVNSIVLFQVSMADEAVNVAIQETGAQAVHPGYGFLSENSNFVKSLDEIGIAFIGPGESAMAKLGDKIQSKIIAKESGVNIIPGYNGVVKDADHALEIANSIGYPVMLKASAGGGGKGMRIAWNDQEVIEGFKLASQESLSSFGDDRLLVEKYIDNPRHIEIQLIADNFGNVFYLPERECSIQRRNQKVIEEAPSTHLDPATRKAMGEQAASLAKHVGYVSAGTVEFLVDSQRNFYFLEMNTRLQVEHPITEYITGMDLVEQMIRIAANQKLSMKQEDIKFHGWAIESRVYAEDPEKYLPSIGRLNKYREPVSITDKNEVRCDSGVFEGSEISIYYDPLICKLSTYGVTHNISLLREVIGSSRFQSGKISTKFLGEEYPKGFKGHVLNKESLYELASVAALIHAKKDLRNWHWLDDKGALLKSTLSEQAPKSWNLWIKINNEHIKTENYPNALIKTDWALESPLINTHFQIADDLEKTITIQYIDPLPIGFRLQHLGTKFDITVHSQRQHELSQYIHEKPKQDLSKFILSPMPGSVISLAVNVGDIVNEGAELAVVEAMKMQNVIRASRVGKVKKVNVKPGDAVAADEIMIEFDEV